MLKDLKDLRETVRKYGTIYGDVKSNIEDVVDNTSTTSSGNGLNPNNACVMIVDIIFDKTIELMKKDTKTSGFYKSIVVSTVNKGREPIKNYLMSLDKKEASDIIFKMKSVLDLMK